MDPDWEPDEVDEKVLELLEIRNFYLFMLDHERKVDNIKKYENKITEIDLKLMLLA